MTILFLTRHFSYLRNFESAIRELARRGHKIHLSADREETMGGRGMVMRIAGGVSECHGRMDAHSRAWGLVRTGA